MLFATLSLGLVLLPFAVGQQVHDIQVGNANGTLAFTPEAIAAQPGDQVAFHFYPRITLSPRAPSLVPAV